jgi:hypothetical protein
MVMKHRGTSKIKMEHNMIPGLRKVLEKIAEWEEVSTIIPGEIKKSRSFGAVSLQTQYETPTGLKILAKANGAVQEVFLVTSQRSEVEQKLKQYAVK